MEYREGEEIAIVNLVRSCRVKGLIHLVFYACCQLEVSFLFHGVKLENGTVEKLSPEDLERCIVGRDKLSAAYHTLADEALWSFGPKCDRIGTCRAERIEIVREVHREFGYHDPLQSIGQALAKKLSKCPACARHIQTKYNQGRGTIWNKIARGFRHWNAGPGVGQLVWPQASKKKIGHLHNLS
jgi:hypothetical protein